MMSSSFLASSLTTLLVHVLAGIGTLEPALREPGDTVMKVEGSLSSLLSLDECLSELWATTSPCSCWWVCRLRQRLVHACSALARSKNICTPFFICVGSLRSASTLSGLDQWTQLQSQKLPCVLCSEETDAENQEPKLAVVLVMLVVAQIVEVGVEGRFTQHSWGRGERNKRDVWIDGMCTATHRSNSVQLSAIYSVLFILLLQCYLFGSIYSASVMSAF